MKRIDKLVGETTVVLEQGDCVEKMDQIPYRSTDIVVTSPPYNIGTKYGKFNDTQPRREYLEWTYLWLCGVKRLLAIQGSFFLNIGSSPSNPWLPHEIVGVARDLFQLQNTFHWIKAITVHTPKHPEISAGHFKPINSKRYVTDCHEYIFHLTHNGDVPLDRLALGVGYADKSNVKRWAHTGGKDKRCRGNVWYLPYETISSREKDRPHPATFPSSLPEMCIKLHGSIVGGVSVLDPFLGIGNSLVAALKLKVGQFYGFELDPTYMKQSMQLVS